MAFSFSFGFTVLTVLLGAVFALFWGAPAIALVSEIFGTIGKRPFPARCARQLSRLAVLTHLLLWSLVVVTGGIFLAGTRCTPPSLADARDVMLMLTIAVPLLGSLALIAYDLSWKGARDRKLAHILLGGLANISLKYGYWSLVAVAALFAGVLSLEGNTVLPPARSALWPAACLWPALAISLSAALSLVYLLLRRSRDDWGRDYYRFAAPFLAKWHLAGGVAVCVLLFWLFFALRATMNLFLPQIAYPALAGMLCLLGGMLLAGVLCRSEHPMRLKGCMLALVGCSLTQIFCLFLALCETVTRYVPGWSLPTFVPDLLALWR